MRRKIQVTLIERESCDYCTLRTDEPLVCLKWRDVNYGHGKIQLWVHLTCLMKIEATAKGLVLKRLTPTEQAREKYGITDPKRAPVTAVQKILRDGGWFERTGTNEFRICTDAAPHIAYFSLATHNSLALKYQGDLQDVNGRTMLRRRS